MEKFRNEIHLVNPKWGDVQYYVSSVYDQIILALSFDLEFQKIEIYVSGLA